MKKAIKYSIFIYLLIQLLYFFGVFKTTSDKDYELPESEKIVLPRIDTFRIKSPREIQKIINASSGKIKETLQDKKDWYGDDMQHGN